MCVYPPFSQLPVPAGGPPAVRGPDRAPLWQIIPGYRLVQWRPGVSGFKHDSGRRVICCDQCRLMLDWNEFARRGMAAGGHSLLSPPDSLYNNPPKSYLLPLWLVRQSARRHRWTRNGETACYLKASVQHWPWCTTLLCCTPRDTIDVHAVFI